MTCKATSIPSPARAAVLLLAAGLALGGCVGGGCDPSEPPDVALIEAGMSREEAEEMLGQRLTTKDTDYGRVSVYRYLENSCTVLIFPMPYIVVLPLYWQDSAQLTVECTPDDKVVSAQIWPQSEDTDVSVELFTQWAKLRQACAQPAIAAPDEVKCQAFRPPDRTAEVLDEGNADAGPLTPGP